MQPFYTVLYYFLTFLLSGLCFFAFYFLFLLFFTLLNYHKFLSLVLFSVRSPRHWRIFYLFTTSCFCQCTVFVCKPEIFHPMIIIDSRTTFSLFLVEIVPFVLPLFVDFPLGDVGDAAASIELTPLE